MNPYLLHQLQTHHSKDQQHKEKKERRTLVDSRIFRLTFMDTVYKYGSIEVEAFNENHAKSIAQDLINNEEVLDTVENWETAAPTLLEDITEVS